MKTFGIIVGLVTILGVIFGIYEAVKPSGPPSFSQSNIGTYSNAQGFLSFLSQHQGQKVALNVTCLELSSQSACSLTESSNPLLIVFGSAAAASCWKNNPAGPCSDGAQIALVSAAFGSNGAGDYWIPQGDYIAQNQGSGGNGAPEGDASYTLSAAGS
jgi:hypothetical protein